MWWNYFWSVTVQPKTLYRFHIVCYYGKCIQTVYMQKKYHMHFKQVVILIMLIAHS